VIYFDSAATTLQKPKSVATAVEYALGHLASSGRGSSAASFSAAETMFDCRTAAAELFGVSEPERVVFTFNATHALNIAIRSLVKPGDTVLISGYEHNAVTRPLVAIPGVRVRVLDTPLFRPKVFLDQLELELIAGVDAVICTHVSNVFGYILPVKEVASLCTRWQVPLILDASQSAGAIPLNMEELGAEFIAMPGHKGLYGPQGTGLLLCRRSGEPLLYGGTGSMSALQIMPDVLPDRLEAGTQNAPGIAGLLQGLRFVKEKGQNVILRHEQTLKEEAARGLKKMPRIQVFQADEPGVQSGVLSFRIDGKDCGEVGEELSSKQIAVRTGLHCAPLAHRSVGTQDTGTIRISFSLFNNLAQVEQFLKVMRQIVA